MTTKSKKIEDLYVFKIEMLHAEDAEKDFAEERSREFAGARAKHALIYPFYEITRLKEDGFVHKDGSLRFKFMVRRSNAEDA